MTSFPRLKDEPQAVGVSFTKDSIELTLADGRRVSTPLSFYPTLLAASPDEREQYEFIGFGSGLEWEQFDLQLSVDGITRGRRETIPPPGFRERTLAAMKKAGVPTEAVTKYWSGLGRARKTK